MKRKQFLASLTAAFGVAATVKKTAQAKPLPEDIKPYDSSITEYPLTPEEAFKLSDHVITKDMSSEDVLKVLERAKKTGIFFYGK